MNQNVGTTDKYIRTLLGVVLAIAVVGNFVQGTAAIAAGIVALVMFVTAWVNFCPIYAMFGLSSRPRKQKT